MEKALLPVPCPGPHGLGTASLGLPPSPVAAALTVFLTAHRSLGGRH